MKDKEMLINKMSKVLEWEDMLLEWEDMRRKVRIIEWLLPRFHKGLSEPKNYEKLIGRVEE